MAYQFNWGDHVAQLNELHQLCLTHELMYTIEFSESGGEWCVDLHEFGRDDSNVFCGRSWTLLENSLDGAIQYLKGLKGSS